MTHLDHRILELQKFAGSQRNSAYIVAVVDTQDGHDYWQIRFNGSCLTLLGLAEEIKHHVAAQFDRPVTVLP